MLRLSVVAVATSGTLKSVNVTLELGMDLDYTGCAPRALDLIVRKHTVPEDSGLAATA
jgi:hypothetical protein